MTTTAERVRDARMKADSALACVRADPGPSPELIAVMGKVAMRADEATSSNDKRTAVIELEQAGENAKAAAVTDIVVVNATRQAVLNAHLATCVAKAKL